MPELPEVQTTVNGLNNEVQGLVITDVWTDYNSSFHAGKNNIKNPQYFKQFKKDLIDTKITNAERHGKNVLVHFGNGLTMLVHMKMTGHFLFGNYIYDKKQNTWQPKQAQGPLRDPFNKYIHLVFSFSNGTQLVFSDLRKFGKVFLFPTNSTHTIGDLMHLGPDPLTPEFTLDVFKRQLNKKPKGKIKQILMDQHIISGIGNIYSDEMLWKAGIHPLSVTAQIPEKNLKELYKAGKEVLAQGIDFGGDSDSDYRNIYGEPGKFQHTHNAYRKTGKPCSKKGCKGTIKRLKVGGRSAHFCDTHQKLYA
jgi:formamidopyrimidine-DNA glycosylase